MSNTPQGLLFVFGQCEPDVSTQEFNGKVPLNQPLKNDQS